MTSFFDLLQKPRTFLVLLLALNAVIHLPFLDMPPVSVHTWRQCNTLAVARNFQEEDRNILRPRVDNRHNGDGITGMQFPSYEYLVSLGYHVFGENHWVERLLSLFITSAGLLAFFGVCSLVFKDPSVACLGAWFYTWSPELFYHSINALPDILALAASVGALYFFLAWRKRNGLLHLILSCLLMTLAGLTKAQYLLAGAPIAMLVMVDLSKKRMDLGKVLQLAIYTIISLGGTLLWYRYASVLSQRSGLYEFAIQAGQSFPKDISKALSIFCNNLFIDLPETLMGYSFFALFVIGGLVSFKKWHSKWAWPMAFWALMLLAYYVMELGQLEFHLYYLLPTLPLLAILAALGARVLLSSKWRWILLLIVIAAPLHTSLKIIPARWANEKAFPKVEFKDEEMLSELVNAVPNGSYCIVGPDASSCILLYYLHKKGSTFHSTKQLLGKVNNKSLLQHWMDGGGEYLYTDDEALLSNEDLAPYIEQVVTEVGSFTVLKLKQPES